MNAWKLVILLLGSFSLIITRSVLVCDCSLDSVQKLTFVSSWRKYYHMIFFPLLNLNEYFVAVMQHFLLLGGKCLAWPSSSCNQRYSNRKLNYAYKICFSLPHIQELRNLWHYHLTFSIKFTELHKNICCMGTNLFRVQYSEMWNTKLSDYISFFNKTCLETVACVLE